MANQSSAKGNPASHRMSNPHYKLKHEKAWKRSQTTKEARREAQKQRERNNAKLRAAGKPTPWEAAEARRLQLRDQARERGQLERQPRTEVGNIVKTEVTPHGTRVWVVPCCQARSRVTTYGRVKCSHLGGVWVGYALSAVGRENYRSGV